MTTKKETKPEIKEVELAVHEVETSSVIVNVEGWRMRIYFAENTAISKLNTGQKVTVKYTGDITDPHSIKFEKLV